MSKIRSHSQLELRALPILERMFGSPLLTGATRKTILHGNKMRFQPDFVHVESKTVIFVHGCFWHGCSDHFRMPKSRMEFWREKIERNQSRDSIAICWYVQRGWNVYIVWEHAIA